MEEEQKEKEKEEQEKAQKAQKIMDEFTDPNNQWEKDKAAMQGVTVQEKKRTQKGDKGRGDKLNAQPGVNKVDAVNGEPNKNQGGKEGQD
jgi:mannan polymerase II complex ANP1 subunit